MNWQSHGETRGTGMKNVASAMLNSVCPIVARQAGSRLGRRVVGHGVRAKPVEVGQPQLLASTLLLTTLQSRCFLIFLFRENEGSERLTSLPKVKQLSRGITLLDSKTHILHH